MIIIFLLFVGGAIEEADHQSWSFDKTIQQNLEKEKETQQTKKAKTLKIELYL